MILRGVIVVAALAGGGFLAYEADPPAMSPFRVDCAGGPFPTALDRAIESAQAKHYPPELIAERPCAWKAQLAQESSLNPDTCDRANSAGARCLAQIVPGTADRIERATGLRGTRSDVHAAIKGGAWLMAQEQAFWSEPRPDVCRWHLALVGYHGGAGWPAKAQAAARRDGFLALCYEHIKAYMERVGVSRENVRLHDVYLAGIESKNQEMVR